MTKPLQQCSSRLHVVNENRRHEMQQIERQHMKEKRSVEKEHMEKVFRRLRPYEKLSFLERYAIFMGKVQIVVLIVKQLLAEDRGHSFEKLETIPLGGLIGLLKKEGANDLLLFSLDDLNGYRKYLAHEFLANQAIVAALLKTRSRGFTKPVRELEKALFSVEQFLLNYESLPAKHRWAR